MTWLCPWYYFKWGEDSEVTVCVTSYSRLTRDLSEATDIRDKLCSFYGQTSYFIAKFNSVTPEVQKRFTCYCSSFYRAELWIYDNGYLYKISMIWRKAVRQLWVLPYRTHCNLLPCMVNGLLLKMLFFLQIHV